MGKLFGTDGIRGRANVYPMSPDLVLKLGQAIGTYFQSHYANPKILIGKDTRKSGYMLEQALGSGICSVGVDVLFLGPLPTPGISYLTRGLRANAGIVISASHNPYSDNGIKIFSKDGYKLPDKVEEELEEMTLNGPLSAVSGAGIGRAKRLDDAVGQYAVFLKERFPKHLTLEGMRIVLDCANGAGYKVAPKVFEELGAEVFTLGCNPNGTNINERCGAMDPTLLAERVKLYKADIGLAFDGDADRLVVVDHMGEVVDGDELLAVCGSHYLEKNKLAKNTLVCTVMSNMGLDLCMDRIGGQTKRTQVGDRYVVELMRREGFNLGGEQSGHLVFRDFSTTGDGILAALCLLEVILEKGQSMAELKKCLERFPQVLNSFEVPKKPPLDDLPELAKLITQCQDKLGDRGRVLFRYSGTENKARIMVEGEDESNIHQMAQEIRQQALNEISAR